MLHGVDLEIGDAVTNGSSSGGHGNDPFLQLYPAIVQCFTIILLGYISARAGIINHTQASGIGSYLTKFALPALLFRSMAEMDFREVKVMFLVCILIVKCTVYFLVFIITLLVTKPKHFGKVGIYSIFVTQGNDIALGYPIISALYGSHQEYINYLYLIQPINMVFLNPLGLALLEIHKWRRIPPRERQSKCKAVLAVIKGIILNPIISMTALGVVANVILYHAFNRQTVPTPFAGILKTLGDSFSAGALFYLGYNMMGKMSGQSSKSSLTIILLLLAKLLLTPVLARLMTAGILKDFYPHDEVKDLASFAFLYGTFPTAPAVFLFAFSYGVAQSEISTGVVLGTFISAPLMFVSTKVAAIQTFANWTDPDLLGLITNTGKDCSIITIICTVWVLLIMVLGRRIMSLPHQFTAFMAMCQCLSGVFMILFFYHHSNDAKQDSTETLIFFGFSTFFIYGGYSWMAVVSIATYMLQQKSLCYLLRKRVYLYLYGFGLPTVTMAMVIGFSRLPSNRKSLNPATDLFFPFGYEQLIIGVTYLLVNVVVTLTGLILLHRHGGRAIWGQSRHPSEAQYGEFDDSVNLQGHPQQASLDFEESQVVVSASSVPNGILKPTPSPPPQNTSSAAENMSPTQPQPMHPHENIPQTHTPGPSIAGTPASGIMQSMPTQRRRKRVSLRNTWSGTGRGTPLSSRQCHRSCAGNHSVGDVEDLLLRRSVNSRSATPITTGQDQIPNEHTPLLQAESHTANTDENIVELANHVRASGDLGDMFMSNMCRAGNHGRCCDRQYEGSCHKKLESYFKHRFYLMTDEERCIFEMRDEHQMKRHIVMVIILLMAAICELLLCVWRLSNRKSIYVELEFLNMAFLAGQGIFAFGIFGFDTEMVVNPLFRKLQKRLCGKAEVDLPKYTELDEDTQRAVESFVDYHKDSCRQDIARCHWHKIRRYQLTFYGHELVDWLIDRGLSCEREDALAMGSRLLNGRVIEHVHKEQYFHDLPYLYQFVSET